MCACKQKKSFLIEDILRDGVKKPYKNLSFEPKVPLICNKEVTSCAEKVGVIGDVEKRYGVVDVDEDLDNSKRDRSVPDIVEGVAEISRDHDFFEKFARRQSSIDYGNIDRMFPGRRHIDNDYWSLWVNSRRVSCDEPNFWPQCYLPRNGAMTMADSCDRRGLIRRHYPNNSTRFAAPVAQALEHRFSVNKYLTPQQRQALAGALRISERQVKTWFQNRRAKWRRGESCQQRPERPERPQPPLGQLPGPPQEQYPGLHPGLQRFPAHLGKAYDGHSLSKASRPQLTQCEDY